MLETSEPSDPLATLQEQQMARGIPKDPQAFRQKRISSFWENVDSSGGPDECWPWLRSRHRNGYGQSSLDGRKQMTHRLAYAFTYGLSPGLHILHSCDNPPCCNPRHLFEGSARDNVADMWAKGRHPPLPRSDGQHNGNAKLTDAQVAEIRRLYVPRKMTYRKLAERFGMHPSSIALLVRGRARTPSQSCLPSPRDSKAAPD